MKRKREDRKLVAGAGRGYDRIGEIARLKEWRISTSNGPHSIGERHYPKELIVPLPKEKK